ncbi:hypothetical protein [Agrobacterium tumefaciens]|uniref:Uncharacterized protein n=1 Tax=Agrobacterium tumefaciens TaxID=358 RepID=A0AA44F7H1_AGRTU|nr:hypothetical protein [Agrobacterium tumefaciens]NSL21746.1 hypothetical protein [Agrobacterium tumefaciens]NTB85517.1 hypothetical protein [Agrobacterium tumefaciens]NTC18862.1 hypothetical protein [Agrobacterium tumefaciens]NTC30844.1 hypothetical protein [Agrobacterium tumefaciens]NTC55708.1 hypothetical protein [Agrobacterium tumefaciens]
MAEKVIVQLDLDTSAIMAATDALNELAIAADKAKNALDGLFGAPESMVTVAVDGSGSRTEEVSRFFR